MIRLVGPTSFSVIGAPHWMQRDVLSAVLTLHAWPSAVCHVCVMASRWQQQPPLASLGISASVPLQVKWNSVLPKRR